MDYLQKKSIRSVAAAIAGFLRHCVRKIGITREKLPSCIALAVCPLVTFYLFEMYTHNHGGGSCKLLCAEFPVSTYYALGYLFHWYGCQCGREF